ncbi:MAG TPA: hypothetical protein VLV18_11450 [Terriglobales bacterium]|nr:hypothetical protein [Terriglobales bacterium]
MSSLLSVNAKRLGKILKDGAEGQVGESGERLENASKSYWPLISNLLITDFKFDRSCRTAHELFKRADARFVAVDGSLDQNLIGGLAIFWAGAYAATGTVAYSSNTAPVIKYDSGFVEKGHGLASCVPIYIDAIPEVEPDSSFTRPAEQMITHSMTEESTVDNSTIASWIMLFSELYLAYSLAKRNEFQIILMDRSLSGMQSSLLRDTAKRALWRRQCAMLRFKGDGFEVDEQDLAYGRYHTLDSKGLLPPRGDYLRHSAMFLLEKSNNPQTIAELATQLGLSSTDRIEKLSKYLKKAADEKKYFEISNSKCSLLPRLTSSWSRIGKMVEFFGDRFFSSVEGNPLQIRDGNQSRWLTTLDLGFLCLFTLNLLVEKCRQNEILLVGITKDTTARDMISHLIPLCTERGIWETGTEHVATTDRMLLQALSMFHAEELSVPWTSIEYDTAFQTIIREYKGKEGFVSGAVKNRIILEQLFVKSYIQLDKSKSDNRFRSNVLFIDRLYHPMEKAPSIKLKHEYGGALEEVEPILWQNITTVNRLQELIMVTLKSMTHESIPEVFGHNEPLFIADKIAKAQRANASQMINGMGHWLVAHPKLRKYSFYTNTFRSRRSEIENARSRA